MTLLKLAPMETGTENIEDQDIVVDSIDEHFGELTIQIRKSEINCDNADEIMDSIRRKGEKYFDDTYIYDGGLVGLKYDVRKTFFTRRFTVESMAKAYDEAEDALKSTMEDVFGVGCVEVGE